MLHICFKQNHKVLRDVRKKLLPMFIANNFLEDRDRKNGRSVMHHAVRQKSALLVKVRRRIVYFSVLLIYLCLARAAFFRCSFVCLITVVKNWCVKMCVFPLLCVATFLTDACNELCGHVCL